MKKIKVLPLVIAALSLGFASCSSERAIDLQEGGVELSLTTSIQDQSRVTTQTDNANHWDENDAIGVFSTNLGAENVKYTANKAGATTDFVGGSIMIPASATTAQAVQAYYPFTAGTASTINIDLATQNDQPVLWASGTVTNAAPVVKLEFQHRLAKLRIVVHPEEGGAALGDNTTVTAVGALSKATFDVVNNGTLNPGVDVADLTLHAVKGTDGKIVEYYTYIMPTQKLTDLEIKISHDDKAYSAKLTSTADVAAGMYYKYTIQLTNGDAELLPGDGTDTSKDAVIADTEEGEDGTNVIPAAPEADTTTTDEPATPADPVNATVTGDNFAGDVLTVPATGGTASITVNVPDPVAADATISAKVAETWVTAADGATLTRAIADKTITFTLEENTGAERTAQVTLSAEGMNDFKFTIKQAKAEPTAGDTTTKYATDLIISEYIEGSLENKAIEIYNGTGKTVDLSQYVLKMENYGGRGSFSAEQEMPLSGTLEHGKTLVIANSKATFPFDISDNNVINFNGNDGVYLYKGETLLDSFGTSGEVFDNALGKDKTYVRKPDVKSPNATFTLDEWIEHPKDTFDNLGSHTMNF